MPDGSACGPKANGSINHKAFTEVSASSMPPNSPHRFIRSPNQLDYPHSPGALQTARFDSSQSVDPDELQAQLPTRTNPTSHGMWPMRGRTAGTTPASVHSLASLSPRAETISRGSTPRRFDNLSSRATNTNNNLPRGKN